VNEVEKMMVFPKKAVINTREM